MKYPLCGHHCRKYPPMCPTYWEETHVGVAILEGSMSCRKLGGSTRGDRHLGKKHEGPPSWKETRHTGCWEEAYVGAAILEGST